MKVAEVVLTDDRVVVPAAVAADVVVGVVVAVGVLEVVALALPVDATSGVMVGIFVDTLGTTVLDGRI